MRIWKRVNLLESDVDILNARLAVLEAGIALENAQNKSHAELVQQSQDLRMAGLEALCTFQVAEIELLDARIAQACGMLNLE